MNDGNKAGLLKVDAFHAVSLGIAKNWAAGSLSILQTLVQGSSIEERLATVTADYLEYCKDTSLKEFCGACM